MLLIQRTESDVKTAGRYQISGFTFGILLPQFLQWKETWYQCKEKCLHYDNLHYNDDVYALTYNINF